VGGIGFHSVDFGTVEIGKDELSRGFSDFAVLYRTNLQGKLIDEVISSAGIPCQLVNRETWMDHETLAELISLLSVIEGSSNLADFERIRGSITPGISRKTARQLKTWFLQNDLQISSLRYMVRQFPVKGLTQARQKRLYAFLGRIYTLEKESAALPVKNKLVYLAENTRILTRIKKSEDILDAFNHLLDYSEPFGQDSNKFLGDLALCRDSDVYMEGLEKVSLMTMHSAKGLEFPVVFIAGCDQKLIPYYRGGLKPSDIDEERRLFYVAITRAREKLFFTFSRRRKIFRKTEDRKISPFVNDIENNLLVDHIEKPKKINSPKQEQMKLF